jgi:hypothetical protein
MYDIFEPRSDVPTEPTGISSSGAADVPYFFLGPAYEMLAANITTNKISIILV